jgi:predicted Zn-dependent protease
MFCLVSRLGALTSSIVRAADVTSFAPGASKLALRYASKSDSRTRAPENVRPYYALYGTAAGAVATGDFSRARQVLQEADALRPDYPLSLAMLVKVNLISSDIDSLKRCLLNAAQRFPRDSKLHAELAQDLLHEKQYDLALAEALRANDGAASNKKYESGRT